MNYVPDSIYQIMISTHLEEYVGIKFKKLRFHYVQVMKDKLILSLEFEFYDGTFIFERLNAYVKDDNFNIVLSKELKSKTELR